MTGFILPIVFLVSFVVSVVCFCKVYGSYIQEKHRRDVYNEDPLDFEVTMFFLRKVYHKRKIYPYIYCFYVSVFIAMTSLYLFTV